MNMAFIQFHHHCVVALPWFLDMVMPCFFHDGSIMVFFEVPWAIM